MNDEEFYNFVNKLPPSYDIIFEKNREKFLETPLKEWPKKAKEYKTMLSIKDVQNVEDYLQTL